MIQPPQSPEIDVKLTYNTNKHIPRNFFIHLVNVPSDAVVRAEYRGEELPVRVKGKGGSIHYGFWIASDTPVTVTVSQNDMVLNLGEYLVHDDKIYSYMSTSRRFKGTLSINYMR